MTKRCPECRYKMEQHGIIENNDVYYCDVCGVYLSYPLEEDDGEELLYASEDEDKVPCSFCSEPIGTVKEVYEDETVDYEVANGEPVCISCYKDWIQEWKNDLDMHYTPFHAESFRADEEFYREYPAKYYQTDEQEGVFFLPDPNDPSDGSYWVVHGEDALTKEQSQKNVFGAEAGKYHITWKDGKKGVTFDFEGGDDMHFDDTWTDLFWDASNPQVTESSKKKRRWFGAEESADDWYGLKKANIWVWDVSPHGKEWNYTDGEGTMIYIDGSNGAIYNRFQRPLPLDEAEAYLKRKGIPYGRVYRNGEWDSVQFTHPKEECYKHDWSKDYHIEDARYEGDDGTGGVVFGQRCNYVLCDAVRQGHVGGKVHWDMAAEEMMAEDFHAPYQPNQTMSNYDTQSLAYSNTVTGDFTTDSLKFGYGVRRADWGLDVNWGEQNMEDEEETYGKIEWNDSRYSPEMLKAKRMKNRYVPPNMNIEKVDGRKYLFLDFDNTVRHTVPDPQPDEPLRRRPPHKAFEVVMIDGVAERVRSWQDAGYFIVGLTNQSNIESGFNTNQDVVDAIKETLNQLGMQFPVYYASHKNPKLPDYVLRKPRTGMIDAAFRDFGSPDYTYTVMVGDDWEGADSGMARNAGVNFIGVLPFIGMDVDEAQHEMYMMHEDGQRLELLNPDDLIFTFAEEYDRKMNTHSAESSYSSSTSMKSGISMIGGKMNMGLLLGAVGGFLLGWNAPALMSGMKVKKEATGMTEQGLANQGFMEDWVGGEGGQGDVEQANAQEPAPLKYDYNPLASGDAMAYDPQTRPPSAF
jgi:HAD superfamily hydrolase (TIGR01662 family)